MLWCCRQGLISGNVRKPFLSPLSQSVCCSANSFLIAALSVGLLFSQFLSYRRCLSRSAVQPVPFLSPLSQSVCCSANSFLIAALSVGLLFSQFLSYRRSLSRSAVLPVPFLSPLSQSVCCSANSFFGVRGRQGLMSTASLNLCRMTGELGVRFLACLHFFFKIASRLAMGPTEPAAQCVPGVHSLGKLAGAWSQISTLVMS